MKGAGELEKKFGASLKPLRVGDVELPALPDLLNNFDGSDEWRRKAKMVLTHGTEAAGAKGKTRFKPHVPGYTKAGMFHNDAIVGGEGAISDVDQLDSDATASADALAARKKGEYRKRAEIDAYKVKAQRAGKEYAEQGIGEEEAWREFLANSEDLEAMLAPGLQSAQSEDELAAAQKTLKRQMNALRKLFVREYEKYLVKESYFGSFHEREKIFLKEQQMLSEGGRGSEDASSQWTISGAQMVKMTNTMNVTDYGELNMSAENIDACADIYIQKMEGDMIVLLETTKEFTTNVGNYFSAAQRRHANKYADNAIDNAQVVVDKLQKDKESSSDEDSE